MPFRDSLGFWLARHVVEGGITLGLLVLLFGGAWVALKVQGWREARRERARRKEMLDDMAAYDGVHHFSGGTGLPSLDALDEQDCF